MGQRRDYVLDVPGGNLTLDIFVLGAHLGVLLDAAFADIGLTASEYAVYSLLARGPQTPGQFREELGVRPATLSGYLAAMERAGHATRSRHEEDGRSWIFTLTPSGEELVAQGRTRMRRVLRVLHGALGSKDDVSAAREALGRVDRAILQTSERFK